jgi:Cd2+/Zn2+-exporting ATPase
MSPQGNRQAFLLRVEGLDCADCALHLEDAVARLPGVVQAEVSFATGRMHLVTMGEGVIPQVQAVAQKMGYEVVLPTAVTGETGWRGLSRHRSRLLPTALAGLLLVLALAVHLVDGPAYRGTACSLRRR